MRARTLFSAIVLYGCASAPPVAETERVLAMDDLGNIMRTPNPDGASVKSVVATPDQAFRAAALAYDQLEIPVATVDPTTRRLGNKQWLFPRRFLNWGPAKFFDCGSNMTGLVADQSRITASVISEVRVVPEDRARSAVGIFVSATARPLSGASGGDALFCSSTGFLEARLQEQVAEQIRRISLGVK
jgi:hypothetical protein